MVKFVISQSWGAETLHKKLKENKMATYNREQGFQSVLNAALGEYHNKGFSLVEPDSHILELFYQDKLVGRFLQSRATISVLRSACLDYLVEANEETGS